ncbi:MAG TPA: S8 family serine peptidase, partial [Pilimelia sp.]|nr:S8 family serine peptidase [Pilimelia sp.]
GSLALLPWLWAGALGGPLESALALLAAAAVGAAAAAVLDATFWDAHRGLSPARRTLRAAPVAGVALVVLGAGVGAPGPHLAVLTVLGALGVAVAALGTPRAAGWAVGVAAVGPLAFVDAEEVTLILTGRDVPFYTVLATAAAVLLAWAGAAARLALPPLARTPAVAAAAALAVVAAGGYAALGQPGFHGDRLFVVLRDQAPLTGLPAAPPGLPGHAARVGAVHARLVAHATRAQTGLRRTLDDLGVAYTPYYLMNAVEVHAGVALLPALQRRTDVARVLPSPRLRPLPAPPPRTTGGAARPPGVGWNVTMVGADAAWQRGATGRGVTVGASDSGVDAAHPALAAGFRGGDDSWYDPWNGSRTPTDRGGHGTHTLGSAVGRLGIGVAPDAQWVGCVNFDRNLANPARYLDCLQYMLAPFPPGGNPFSDGRPARAPHVLTNSWGCPPVEGCDADTLRPATAALAAAGIFVVAAAGNSGPGCGTVTDPPAPYADVFTVGAVDRHGAVGSFSSRGPAADGTSKPDVVAPGEDVLSAMPGGGYEILDGTSMAAPHVAGVVALLWSARPALAGDVAGTAGILRRTAGTARTAGARCAGAEEPLVGAGLVDAPAALAAAAR